MDREHFRDIGELLEHLGAAMEVARRWRNVYVLRIMNGDKELRRLEFETPNERWHYQKAVELDLEEWSRTIAEKEERARQAATGLPNTE